jgi:hypothetical protein
MRRREVLKRTGAAAGVGLLGGCLDRYRDAPVGNDPDGGSTTTGDVDDTSDTGNAGETSETGGEDVSELADSSLELVDADCGNPDGRASVRFRRSEGVAVVDGTISASDPCHVARLAGTELDPKTGEFTVTVETARERTTGTTACVQCIGAIEYDATFRFDGGLPASVTVVHRGLDGARTVATAEPGAETAAGTTSTATTSTTTE